MKAHVFWDVTQCSTLWVEHCVTSQQTAAKETSNWQAKDVIRYQNFKAKFQSWPCYCRIDAMSFSLKYVPKQIDRRDADSYSRERSQDRSLRKILNQMAKFTVILLINNGLIGLARLMKLWSTSSHETSRLALMMNSVRNWKDFARALWFMEETREVYQEQDHCFERIQNDPSLMNGRLRVVGFCSWNPRRAELFILCKLGKETRREWGEAGKNLFSFSSSPALLAASSLAARARPAHIANLATLGKERDGSQSRWTGYSKHSRIFQHSHMGFLNPRVKAPGSKPPSQKPRKLSFLLAKSPPLRRQKIRKLIVPRLSKTKKQNCGHKHNKTGNSCLVWYVYPRTRTQSYARRGWSRLMNWILSRLNLVPSNVFRFKSLPSCERKQTWVHHEPIRSPTGVGEHHITSISWRKWVPSTELDTVTASFCNLCALAVWLVLSMLHIFAIQCWRAPTRAKQLSTIAILLYRLVSWNVFQLVWVSCSLLALF